MARHRSPRGRAHRHSGAHRSPTFPIPLRGAAVAAVTGGALSLIATTVPPVPAGEPATALRLAAEDPQDERADPDDGDRDEDGIELRPSVQPVRAEDPDDDRFDVDRLLESVARAEAQAVRAQQRAAEQQAREDAEEAAEDAREQAREQAERAREGCEGLRTGGLGAVKPHVREAGAVLGCRFGKPVMLGVAGRGGPSDHPGGLAIDFMVDRATGDALAECALANMEALGVKYVIWEQRINHGDGWQPMADRGGVTANHFDHVHVSFNRGAGGGDLAGC
ncbi:MAG: hypothetical protein ACT4RN_15265 [Pseudonocardia sp.]